MKDFSRAVAYPGLPIVFAEGYREVEGRRISGHGSVGCALTDPLGAVRTETTVRASDSGNVFTVDGKQLLGSRSEGMVRIVEMLSAAASHTGDIEIESRNHNILSGSSDSGAAALLVALDDFFGLGLGRDELLNVGLFGSETVFRSLYGGLTEYFVDGGRASTELLAGTEELSDIAVFGVNFPGGRLSADEIHKAVVNHPSYNRRVNQANERIEALKKCLDNEDLSGALNVMEEEARTVHGLFAEVGKPVISEDMRVLCESVEGWRRGGLDVYWNVAGGRQVYVFCLRDRKGEVASRLLEGGWEALELEIAGEAKVLV